MKKIIMFLGIFFISVQLFAQEVKPITKDGIIVQGGKQANDKQSIIVQGGKTSNDKEGIIVQGGKQATGTNGIIVQGGKEAIHKNKNETKDTSSKSAKEPKK